MQSKVENTRPFDPLRARHSFAHLLAAAVKRLHPSVKFGIVPVLAQTSGVCYYK